MMVDLGGPWVTAFLIYGFGRLVAEEQKGTEKVGHLRPEYFKVVY